MGKKFIITEEMRLLIATAIVKTASPYHNPAFAYYVCNGENGAEAIIFSSVKETEEVLPFSIKIRCDHLLWLHPISPELGIFNIFSQDYSDLLETQQKQEKAVRSALSYIRKEYHISPYDKETTILFDLLEKIDRTLIIMQTIQAGILSLYPSSQSSSVITDDDYDYHQPVFRSDTERQIHDYISALRNARTKILVHRQSVYPVLQEILASRETTRETDYYYHGWQQAMLLVASVLGIPVR